MPVTLNEPLSQLQRHAEDLEYAELINRAVDLKDSVKRLLYVASFACSKHVSASSLYTRSFNPLLGETYEFVDPKKKYRYFAEQIQHHPPMLAICAESPRWTYHGEAATRNVLRMTAIDVNHIGTWFLTLRLLDGTEELYTWRKPGMVVKMPLVSGEPVIEEYGAVNVRNWSTGEVCTIDGFKVDAGSEFRGKVFNELGRLCAELSGCWNETIVGNVFADTERKEEFQKFQIWESNRRRANRVDCLTPFLVGLNDIPRKLRNYIPPTDSRLRPDQRALEDGQCEFADVEKKRLEDLQRKRQRRRKEDKLDYAPRWFKREKCIVTGEDHWSCDREYWRERERSNEERWKSVENIFTA
ncbi:putative oxysterol-binding protein 1A [Mollisia scopiformis]|uniref:Putative oxysterol-binding protein 1A n=1 Tax=Mollisia scopiformis TaxID=149040 RepID=A0A194XJW4_MOLSC|nr:putative oxysterol-binding protein 1A [Mollisia scopiformis]KUJ20077.1 putative oxysterol-binding protein 1A [Mollisia scopiformis]